MEIHFTSLTSSNVATGIFNITYMDDVIFLLDSSVSEVCVLSFRDFIPW